MIGSSWPGLKVMQSNNLKTNFPSMAFRSLKAFQVWRFGRKLVSKYGISVAQNPDFTLKSENAELMPLELTIIESLTTPENLKNFPEMSILKKQKIAKENKEAYNE